MNEYDSVTTQPFRADHSDATDYVSNAFELDSVDSEVAEADSDDSEDTQIFDAPKQRKDRNGGLGAQLKKIMKGTHLSLSSDSN